MSKHSFVSNDQLMQLIDPEAGVVVWNGPSGKLLADHSYDPDFVSAVLAVERNPFTPVHVDGLELHALEVS